MGGMGPFSLWQGPVQKPLTNMGNRGIAGEIRGQDRLSGRAVGRYAQKAAFAGQTAIGFPMPWANPLER